MDQLRRGQTVQINQNIKWGKLIPLGSGLTSYDLQKNKIILGRLQDCDIQISDKRLSGHHCAIQKKKNLVFITDLSSNGTFIGLGKIGKNNQVPINNNAQLWILPSSKVKPSQAIGFRIQYDIIEQNKQIQQQKKTQSQQKQKQKTNIQDKNQQQKKKRQQQDRKLKQQITCAYCLQIMYIPVTVQPCNHRFCGGCLSQLVLKKKIDCIKCRKNITTAAKDASFNSIVQLYLNNHPQDQRDPQQVKQLKQKNIFSFQPLDVKKYIKNPKKKAQDITVARGRRRTQRSAARLSIGSDLSASDDDEEQRCRQCMTQRDGYKCQPTTNHKKCFNCLKLIADRNDKKLHQYCVLCTQYFCNLYYPPCKSNGMKLQLIKNMRQKVKIDKQLLRQNQYQFQFIKSYLISNKMTSKQLFDKVLQKMQTNQFSYLYDKKIMKIAPLITKQVKLNSDDSVCTGCWNDLWFQMVFYYRNLINQQLPIQVKNRPACYWGINCRTMTHNDDHAKRYNHMTYQVKFL